MPILRATFFFKDDGGHGWTETIHNNASDLTAMMIKAKALLPKRVKCLGQTAHLTFIRVSDDLILRDSMIYQVPGEDTNAKNYDEGESDIANTCLVIRLDATPITRRTLYMRGIPDNIVKDAGVYTPSGTFRTALNAWAALLKSDGWCCKSRIGVNVAHPIANIAQNLTTGRVTITTSDAHDLAPNDAVTIKGVSGANAINGNTSVVTTPDNVNFTINSRVIIGTWTGGGNVTKLGFTLAPITAVQPRQISHRNAGRPFDSPRGRRTRSPKR